MERYGRQNGPMGCGSFPAMVTAYESTNVFPLRRSEDVRTYGLLGLHCGSAICSPLRNSRSDGVAKNGFELFGVVYFPVFRILLNVSRLGVSSRILSVRRHFVCSCSLRPHSEKSNHIAIYTCCKHLAVVSNFKKRYHNDFIIDHQSHLHLYSFMV